MTPNKLIRTRREVLGLKSTEVASLSGLSIHEYWDIEAYEDEAYTVARLRQLRAMAKVLSLDILAMFGIECQFCSGGNPDRFFCVPRNELILSRRTALRLSRDQLGDRIGFETIAVEEMEQNPDFVEEWSVELIQLLAAELGIPAHALLRVPCAKCGQGSLEG